MLVSIKDILDVSINRRISSRIIQHSNKYIIENKKTGNVYISWFFYHEYIVDLPNFNIAPININEDDYIGVMAGYSMYINNSLNNDEFFIGQNSLEIEKYKRNIKIKKIVNKLNV